MAEDSPRPAGLQMIVSIMREVERWEGASPAQVAAMVHAVKTDALIAKHEAQLDGDAATASGIAFAEHVAEQGGSPLMILGACIAGGLRAMGGDEGELQRWAERQFASFPELLASFNRACDDLRGRYPERWFPKQPTAEKE